MSKPGQAFKLPGSTEKYTHKGVIALLIQSKLENDADWKRLSYINRVLKRLRKISSRPGCLRSGNSLSHYSSRSAAASLVVFPRQLSATVFSIAGVLARPDSEESWLSGIFIRLFHRFLTSINGRPTKSAMIAP